MPWGDGTGPMGAGPMTGRGLGYCGGYGAPGYTNPAPGRGFGYGRGWGRGRGFGRGFGFRARFYPYYGGYTPAVNPQQEKDILKEQAKVIQQELNAINKRLKDLENKDSGAKE